MKRFLILISILISVLVPVSVYAKGDITVSPSKVTIKKGESATITITAYNTIGDVMISTSNSSIASISTKMWQTGMVGDNTTKTGTLTVTGVSSGTATIYFVLDAATFDAEDLSNQRRSVSVEVLDDTKSNDNNNNNNDNNTNNQPTNNNDNSNNNNNNNSNTNTTNNTKNTIQKSTNNNIRDLSIEGYTLNMIDANNYTLIVDKSVKSVVVKATPEDTKAKVSITGGDNLVIGENNIKVVITSESGSDNIINIVVTRKSEYKISDLDEALKDEETNDIVLDKNDKLTKEDLTKIKNSGKKVNLKYYDELKKLLYEIVIDGNKLENYDDLYTDLDIRTGIDPTTNKEGLIVSFKNMTSMPKGIKVRVYVGDKYSDGDLLDIFKKGVDGLSLILHNLAVKAKYIEFETSEANSYFVTKSVISNATNSSALTASGVGLSKTTIMIGLIAVIVVLASLIVLKLKDNY